MVSSEASPTIKALETNRYKENLSGSPIQQRRILFGKEYSFYKDGSVLVFDSQKREYHFLTAEGKKLGKDARKSAEELERDESILNTMKLLGKGKGAVSSSVYELSTLVGNIAVKTTDNAGFLLKELVEEQSTNAKGKDPVELLTGRQSTRKVVQKMSLKDTMQLLRKLDENGIRNPEFYGFSVKRDASSGQIQEFQFMEEINKPTMQAILDAAAKTVDRQTGSIDLAKLPHSKLLQDMANKYYQGDSKLLLIALVKSFKDFVSDTKKAIPNIADLEMDNIFLYGYDETTAKPEFMLIDPIEEYIYLRPIQLAEDI